MTFVWEDYPVLGSIFNPQLTITILSLRRKPSLNIPILQRSHCRVEIEENILGALLYATDLERRNARFSLLYKGKVETWLKVNPPVIVRISSSRIASGNLISPFYYRRRIRVTRGRANFPRIMWRRAFPWSPRAAVEKRRVDDQATRLKLVWCCVHLISLHAKSVCRVQWPAFMQRYQREYFAVHLIARGSLEGIEAKSTRILQNRKEGSSPFIAKRVANLIKTFRESTRPLG